MSNYSRDSQNANSAIIVTIFPRDFGNNLLDGINFQRKLEERAYELGSGNIPVQLLGDFINNRKSVNFGSIEPVFKGNYKFADLNKLLPDDIKLSLKEAFPYFGKKIKGFDNNDTILAGIENYDKILLDKNKGYKKNAKSALTDLSETFKNIIKSNFAFFRVNHFVKCNFFFCYLFACLFSFNVSNKLFSKE